jgi:hypothetical protein
MKPKRKKLNLPVVSLSAEYLVTGHLLRRNILTYKAPPNNQGYDLLCTHPDPALATKTLRIQVKSRYQTDCDRSVPVRKDSFACFDYLVIVFLNVGLFFGPDVKNADNGAFRSDVEYLVLPNQEALKLLRPVKSGFSKVHLPRCGLGGFRDEEGIELIARDLRVSYPSRHFS